MKILYVEDNDDNVYVIETRLQALGYQLIVATDGAAGVRAAAGEQPDLILMDLSLPVLDGWAATRALKSAAATRHIPVIALTSRAMVGERDKALAAGCDEFETKPIDFPGLLQKIRTLAPQRS